MTRCSWMTFNGIFYLKLPLINVVRYNNFEAMSLNCFHYQWNVQNNFITSLGLYGTSFIFMSVFTSFSTQDQDRSVRAPSMRLRFGRRSDNNMFLLPYEVKFYFIYWESLVRSFYLGILKYILKYHYIFNFLQ